MNMLTDCRILYLVGQLGVGGQERQLYYLLQAMNRDRYRPAVVAWNAHGHDGYAPEIRSLGVPLHCFDGELSPGAKLVAFRRILRKLSPEVVHSFSFYTNYAAHLGTWNMPALPIGSLRSDIVADRKRVGSLLGVLSSRWPREQIANNVSTTEQLRKLRRWCVPKRVHLVRNAVDMHTFGESGPVLRQDQYIVGVGSLTAVKRWDRVLRAVKELRSRGYACRMRIAGDGPLLESLRHEAVELGVAKHVAFLGNVSGIPRLISEGLFLVHASDTEGCPNAVMEAMACGRAVVATDAGDVPYVVNDGETGFIVERGNEMQLAEKMATLIDHPHLCRTMGKAGRAKAEREFGMARYVHDMMAAYRAAGWKD